MLHFDLIKTLYVETLSEVIDASRKHVLFCCGLRLFHAGVCVTFSFSFFLTDFMPPSSVCVAQCRSGVRSDGKIFNRSRLQLSTAGLI